MELLSYILGKYSVSVFTAVYALVVCPSAHLSVLHTPVLYQNG